MLTRRSGRLFAVFVVFAVGAACSGPGAPAIDRDATAAAETLCPIMWDWVKNIGGAFNDASRDVAEIDDPSQRRDRWRAAFDEMEALNGDLDRQISAFPTDETLGPLVAEITRDIPRANGELDALRQLLDDHPEIDEQRHQARTQQLIVRVEKVVDLPKPDLAALDIDGSLLPAFREVPSCQQSIRDADGGRPQSNG